MSLVPNPVPLAARGQPPEPVPARVAWSYCASTHLIKAGFYRNFFGSRVKFWIRRVKKY